MRKYLKVLLPAFLIALTSLSGKAQFYQIANQLPGLIRPALSGSFNYKGYVDVSYLAGVGNKRVDFINISTSQGFKYNDWFYMGVGIGVDIVNSKVNDGFGPGSSQNGGYWNHSYKTSGVMIPVFTDFRFNIGKATATSFYIDARLGASFLMGDSYLAVANGFITNREYFYLKPSVGVRIPVKSTGKQAIDIGFTYQLLTSNYWYYNSGNTTLNAIGATLSFEW